MRTAAEIAKEFIPCTCDEAYISRKLIAPDCPLHAFDVESAINAARKEAIEYCAENAEAYIGVDDQPRVSKGSITLLIDELK